MNRIQFFEIMDQSWCPEIIRNEGTDLLEFWMRQFDTYQPIYPLIIDTMKKTQSNNLIDLCSGSGGPILQLSEFLHKQGYDYTIYLTDKYPNKKVQEQLKGNNKIHYLAESIDAIHLSPSYQGMRTLFTSFHHFKPEMAIKIIEDAALNRAPIGIFEFTERNAVGLLKILLTPLSVFLLTPFVKPHNLQRFIYAYLIPILPLVLLWDGIVSCLRTYSVSELHAFTSTLEKYNYVWEIGKVPSKKAMCNITYLIGYPKVN